MLGLQRPGKPRGRHDDGPPHAHHHHHAVTPRLRWPRRGRRLAARSSLLQCGCLMQCECFCTREVIARAGLWDGLVVGGVRLIHAAPRKFAAGAVAITSGSERLRVKLKGDGNKLRVENGRDRHRPSVASVLGGDEVRCLRCWLIRPHGVLTLRAAPSADCAGCLGRTTSAPSLAQS